MLAITRGYARIFSWVCESVELQANADALEQAFGSNWIQPTASRMITHSMSFHDLLVYDGKNMAKIWQKYGKNMATIWQTYGKTCFLPADANASDGGWCQCGHCDWWQTSTNKSDLPMWMHRCNRSMRQLSNRWVCFAFLLCLLQTSTLYDLMISYVISRSYLNY